MDQENIDPFKTVNIESETGSEHSVPVVCPQCKRIIRVEKRIIADGVKVEPVSEVCSNCTGTDAVKIKKISEKPGEMGRTKILPPELREKKNIPYVCIKCKRVFKIKDWQVETGKRTGVSHGLCPACFEKLEKENDSLK